MIDFEIYIMKIFSAEQIKSADQYTILHEPVSSIQLMERAATACKDWILKHKKSTETFYLFCGNGNNGGDGFALARMLYLSGKNTYVFTPLSKSFSEDAKINLDKLKQISGIEIRDLQEIFDFQFSENSIFIDALFGTGLNRNLDGEMAEIIQQINRYPQYKLAIDLPSGLFADHLNPPNFTVFKADETLSFQFWKKTFLHPETAIYCGNIHILDIHLHQDYISQTTTHQYNIDLDIIKNFYRPRNPFSHKGDFGKVCIVGGSFGMMGAEVLAVKAALKSGSGLTYALAPKCGYEILQTSCPEAMYLYGGENNIHHFNALENFSLGIGPGLSKQPEVAHALLSFLKTYTKPLVLDADALNILSDIPDGYHLIPKSSIITPHPKEFERLFGKTDNSYQRLDLAIKKAQELHITIVLKGHRTQIISPKGEVFYNITGNAGLSKGGSGDVLTGIITSLLAQQYSPLEASIFGVWLHGKAADLAILEIAQESLLATDVIQHISKAFRFLNESLSSSS